MYILHLAVMMVAAGKHRGTEVLYIHAMQHVFRQHTNFMFPLLQEILCLKECLGEPDENFGSRGQRM